MVIQAENKSKKSFIEKIGKRNVIAACAVLLIGAAIWVNWMFFATEEDGYKGYDDVSGNLSASQQSGAEDNYFATVQVSRERTRDEALEVLQSVVDNASADEAVKTQALSDINKLALEMSAESNIETLVMAKGFEDCVAVINGDGATVVVKTSGEEGLLPNQIAQINEIVYEQAQIKPVNITITARK
jgi:stage III sporulation protein AH